MARAGPAHSGNGELRMADEQLTITLVGADEDDEDARLGDFAKFCATLTQCLRIIEQLETDHRGKAGFKIVNLTHGSAGLTIATVPPKRGETLNGRVLRGFRETVQNLETGGPVDVRLTLDDLRQFRKLREGKYRKGVTVGDVEITTQYIANIDRILGKAIESEGSISGRLERLDAHETRAATLFTATGDSVACIFTADNWPKAKEAFERHVTLYGRLTYRVDAPFPTKVRVREIDIHPPDEQLPTGEELRGLFGKDATDGMSAEDFVRSLRDDEG